MLARWKCMFVGFSVWALRRTIWINPPRPGTGPAVDFKNSNFRPSVVSIFQWFLYQLFSAPSKSNRTKLGSLVLLLAGITKIKSDLSCKASVIFRAPLGTVLKSPKIVPQNGYFRYFLDNYRTDPGRVFAIGVSSRPETGNGFRYWYQKLCVKQALASYLTFWRFSENFVILLFRYILILERQIGGGFHSRFPHVFFDQEISLVRLGSH